MAIFIEGMKCTICDKKILSNESKIMFPPITSDKDSKFFIFSDAVVHTRCFDMHPLKNDLENLLKEIAENSSPSKRICVICKKEIINPDDYFDTSYITDKQEDPLYKYNYKKLHKNCIKDWKEAIELSTILNNYQSIHGIFPRNLRYIHDILNKYLNLW